MYLNIFTHLRNIRYKLNCTIDIKQNKNMDTLF